MSGFKLDTSGSVRVPDALLGEPRERSSEWRWSDLSPFAQGYIEAAFGGGIALYDGAEVPRVPLGFSDLAPATLAAMLEDCERFVAFRGHEHCADMATFGLGFWEGRKNGVWDNAAFPPVHLYLADDGKIQQREAR